MGVVPYIARGEGPPVVLIHGLGGFKEAWGALPGALAAAGRRVHAVDLPGSGAAPRPRRGTVSSRGHARGLAPWIDDLGPVGIVAHSLGAQVALMLAAERPGGVSSLALLAPVVVPGVRRVPRSVTDLLSVPVAGPLLAHAAIAPARRRHERCRASILGAAGDPSRLRPGSREALLLEEAAARLRHADLRAMTAWASSGLRAGALPAAATVTTPTLVVVGERDRLTPPADIDRLARVLGGPRILRLPGVGHFPHIEACGPTLDAVVAHIGASVDREPAA
ncbi:MAG: alpha/beta fold hydrolase [Thermoleophilia bacterium]